MTRASWRRRRSSCERDQSSQSVGPGPFQHRHRPRHHALRLVLGRHAGQRWRAGGAGRAADPAADRPRRGRGAAAAAVLPVSAARERARTRRPGPALEREPGLRGGRVRALARRGDADPAGRERQELALPSGRRPARAHPAGGGAGRGAARLAAGGFGALPVAPEGGLESGAPGGAVRAAAGHGHDSGLVRSGGARADRRGRTAGGLRQSDAARGAAGGALQLDPAEFGRLAQAGAARRRDPGGRHRRRHDRPVADRGARARRRARAAPGRGRRPYPARR